MHVATPIHVSEPAARDHWTLASALRGSSTLVRCLAVASVVVTLGAAVNGRVPLVAAVPVALLVGAALVDLIDRRLPDNMVATAAAAGVAVGAFDVLTGGHIDMTGVGLGCLAFAGPLLAMHLVAPVSMGFGDVKAAVVLGAALGTIDPLLALLALTIASLLGVTVGFARRHRSIAFGPALVGGAVVALVLVASPLTILTTIGISGQVNAS